MLQIEFLLMRQFDTFVSNIDAHAVYYQHLFRNCTHFAEELIKSEKFFHESCVSQLEF